MSKKPLLLELSKADYVTIMATFLIVNAFWLLWNDLIYLAIAFAFVSIYLDYLDGTIARKYGGSPYGKTLDSLYDVLGLVLFPSLVINIQSDWAWWAVIVTTIFCLASVMRLSRFTVKGYVESDKRYYTGVPVLYSKYALLLVLIAEAKFSVLIMAIMIPFMVSSRLVKKPHPIFAHFNLIYAIIFIFLFIKL